jgi:N-acetylmuramoyl-L-alanine amidase
VLDARLGIRKLLTRETTARCRNDERASIANNNKADLFVSLHANSSPNKSAKGAEVFYLSLDGLGADARKMVESPGRPYRFRRRLARHRPHPVGHGPGPAPERVGGFAMLVRRN